MDVFIPPGLNGQVPMPIFGFEEQKKMFKQGDGELHAGAYLFYGQQNIGKMTFAVDLAYKLIGQKNLDKNQSSANLLVINCGDSKSGQTISIDNIREINRFLSFAPSGSKFKVVLIDDAHLMQEPAQNALLKLMEEPPDSAFIILVSHKHESILPTILSRCRKIYFPPHNEKTIKKIIDDARVTLTDDQITFLLEFSSGKSGLILKILQDQSFKKIKETIKEFYDIKNMTMAERIKFASKFAEQDNETMQGKILYWILYLRSHILKEDRGHSLRTIKNLLNLHYVLSMPRFNHRLAIENFAIQL